MKKRVLLLGATGSIGGSVIEVLREQSDHLALCGVSAYSRADDLLRLAQEFQVDALALSDSSRAANLQRELPRAGACKLFVGANACEELVRELDFDILVNALMGSAGIAPTMAAIERGKRVALANKETLVAAGPIVLKRAQACGAEVIPIDSEHSAIYQCLQGEDLNRVRTIWLTTSGGPFWGRKWETLSSVTPKSALAHPTWKMGPKITIDSSTLFNKGLEVIETQRLFGVKPEQIKVLAHRQSVIHSLVEFVDGSIKAQLSTPDMKLPILYALSSPGRFTSSLVPTDLCSTKQLTFEPVESGMFPLLDLALTALQRGGTVPAALSAADEVAVQAFLDHELGYTELAAVLEEVISDWPSDPFDTLEQVFEADRLARLKCREQIRAKMTRKVRVA